MILELEHVLNAETLGRIRQEMRMAPSDAATVTGAAPGRSVLPTARKSTQVAVGEAARTSVVALLEHLERRIEAHFERPLDGFEPPQFLRYRAGDFFVAHQDGNTPLVHDDSRFRKVSVVIFLNSESEFGGGSLVLHGERSLQIEAGRLVAFPSETTHEVLPITRGERLSVASWYRGP